MAKVIESDKGFLLIECTEIETQKIGGIGICDSCNKVSDKGIYISVLNSWYCMECFNDWHKGAIRYQEDIYIEKRHFNHTMDRLLIFAEELANEMIEEINKIIGEIDTAYLNIGEDDFVICDDDLTLVIDLYNEFCQDLVHPKVFKKGTLMLIEYEKGGSPILVDDTDMIYSVKHQDMIIPVRKKNAKNYFNELLKKHEELIEEIKRNIQQ